MSGMPWFRLYSEFAYDPEIQSLAFEDQRHFVMALCLKCSGVLDKIRTRREDRERILKRALGLDSTAFDEATKRLVHAGLIDEKWQPKNWDKRQYRTDGSYERVKRHRQRRAEAGLPQQTYIPKAVRDRVFERDGHKCVACSSTNDLTIDHKKSEINGGSNDEDNLQTLCRQCNGSKRDHEDEVFQKRFRNGPREQSQSTDTEEDSPPAADALTHVPVDPFEHPDPLHLSLKQRDEKKREEERLKLKTIGKTKIDAEDKPDPPYAEIAELYRTHCVPAGFLDLHTLTKQRLIAIRARWYEDPQRQRIVWWEAYFKYAATRCKGIHGTNWGANFSFLISDKMVDVAEGRYEQAFTR